MLRVDSKYRNKLHFFFVFVTNLYGLIKERCCSGLYKHSQSCLVRHVGFDFSIHNFKIISLYFFILLYFFIWRWINTCRKASKFKKLLLLVLLLHSRKARMHTNHADFEPIYIYRNIQKKLDAIVFQGLLKGSLSFMLS